MRSSVDRIVGSYGTGIVLSFSAYLFFALYAARNSPLSWLIPVGIAFFFYYRWFFGQKKIKNLRLIFITGALFRLIFLFHTPVLSDDYARFIWDGKINLEGKESVYQSTPSQLIGSGKSGMQNEKVLYTRLNSPGYYSVYPPGSQLVFTVSVMLGRTLDGALVVMRILIWLAEIAICSILLLVLKKYKKSSSEAGKYFLNPLVIIEWSGSLHLEGIMIAFFLSALWYASRNKWIGSAFFWFLAVAMKLIPFLFIPVLWKRISFNRTLLFGTAVFFFLVISFLPFLSLESGNGFFDSLNLYFQRFEFNGSIYLALREPIRLLIGYNPNYFLVPVLMIASLVVFVSLFFRQKKNGWKDLIEFMVCLWMIWYFFSPVVHPWYITPMLVLACISNGKSIYIWSGLIFLSYLLYWDPGLWMVFVVLCSQYIPVYRMFIAEYYCDKVTPSNSVTPSAG